jgi:hypothetical protein
MGLFDKKKKKGIDDFDSPVEQIDLSAPAPQPAAQPQPRPDPAPEPSARVPAAAGEIAPAAPAARAAEPRAAAPSEPDDDYDTLDYGIDKAIELMRTLPSENVELVVQVVKTTLESLNVKVAAIIRDATRKQDDIQGRIKSLRAEIAEYEAEIATRREEIGTLEADFKETSMVKERLQMAERPAATRSPLGATAARKPPSPTGEQAMARKPPTPTGEQPRPPASADGSAPKPAPSGPGPSKTTIIAKK